MEVLLTTVWSHSLSRHLTASKTLSLPSSTRPLRARETCVLVGEAMIAGLSNSFTLSETFTSCMDLRDSIRVGLKRPHRKCSNRSNLGVEGTHFVMPLLNPAMQARDPFKLLTRLLFPTLGKPGNQRGFFSPSFIYMGNVFSRKRAVKPFIWLAGWVHKDWASLSSPTTPTFSGAPFFVLAANLVRICVKQLPPTQVAALDGPRSSFDTDIFLFLPRW